MSIENALPLHRVCGSVCGHYALALASAKPQIARSIEVSEVARAMPAPFAVCDLVQRVVVRRTVVAWTHDLAREDDLAYLSGGNDEIVEPVLKGRVGYVHDAHLKTVAGATYADATPCARTPL